MFVIKEHSSINPRLAEIILVGLPLWINMSCTYSERID